MVSVGTHPFFLKPSEKPPNAFVWKKPIAHTCLHGVNHGPIPSNKVAAWDLDGTLIKTRSGSKFARDKDDWMWWRASVKKKITDMHEEGYVACVYHEGIQWTYFAVADTLSLFSPTKHWDRRRQSIAGS